MTKERLPQWFEGSFHPFRSLRARLLGEVGFALPFALVTMLTTGTLATSTLAYTRAS